MSETEFVALCLETLGQGAVQSYIDLMYIAAEGSLTLKQLRTIRDHLLAAEQGRRRGDAAAVSNAFIALSELFKGLGRMRMGLFFMDRLLEVARLTGDRKSEMRARHELGAAEEELGNDEAALMHHHAHRELATAAADEEGKAQACRHLAAVFARQAKEHEKKGEHAKALELYLASLEAADSTNDDVTVADASYSAGRSYCVNGQADAAVPLFQAFLRLCLSSEALHERELTAYAALAAAQLAAGNWDAATECLEEVVNAPDADGRLLAEANEQLGLIAARRGKVEEAARCLEGSFENWRALQGTEWADRSRLEKVSLSSWVVGACPSLCRCRLVCHPFFALFLSLLSSSCRAACSLAS